MKIIFICTKSITFNTFLKSQANYLLKKGERIQVACSDSEKLDIEKKFRYKIDFPNRKIELINIFKYIRVFKQINKLIKNNPKAIFYLHTPLASHLFRFFTYYNKLKIVYFVHGFRFTSKTNFFKAFFLKIIEIILSTRTNVFLTINNEDFHYTNLKLLRNNRCFKINGVGIDLKKNLKKINIKKNKLKKILVIAAYKREKGYPEILKVAEILKDQKIKIDCFGYGEYSKFNLIKFKKKLTNLSLNKFDKNLEFKISDYDVLLHLSKREGLPVALIQCLSNGLPIICYKIRGNIDLVKDNFNGFLINSYKEVENKINYLILNNNIFNKMRINSFNSINNNFSKERINSKIYQIIKSLQKNEKI